MKVQIKGLVVSDSGVKEFKGKKGEIIKFRQIGVLADNDKIPFNISVDEKTNYPLRSDIDVIGDLTTFDGRTLKLRISLPV